MLCPRNKFIAPSLGADRIYRFVKVTEVVHASSTILATEMIDNARALGYDDLGTGWIMSHRPVSGYISLNGELDLFQVPVGEGFRQPTRDDLDADPDTVSIAFRTRLDLVGRKHGKQSGYPDRRLNNSLHVDGHVENKWVYDTMQPFEWGDRFYSLMPNNDQVSPSQ